MGKPLPDELKQQIADYLLTHKTTIKAAAKRFKVSRDMICTIRADYLGIEPNPNYASRPDYEPTPEQIAAAAAEIRRRHLAEKRAGAGASPTCEFRGRVFNTSVRQGRTGISYLCG